MMGGHNYVPMVAIILKIQLFCQMSHICLANGLISDFGCTNFPISPLQPTLPHTTLALSYLLQQAQQGLVNHTENCCLWYYALNSCQLSDACSVDSHFVTAGSSSICDWLGGFCQVLYYSLL